MSRRSEYIPRKIDGNFTQLHIYYPTSRYSLNITNTIIQQSDHQQSQTHVTTMSPSRTPGPWNGVNGPRVLTEAQRQRKRERDRATKREEKIKNQQRLQELEQTKEYATRRIQELEAQVEVLQKTCRCKAGNTGGSSQRGSVSHNVTIQCSPPTLVPSTLPYEENNGSISKSFLSSTFTCIFPRTTI